MPLYYSNIGSLLNEIGSNLYYCSRGDYPQNRRVYDRLRQLRWTSTMGPVRLSTRETDPTAEVASRIAEVMLALARDYQAGMNPNDRGIRITRVPLEETGEGAVYEVPNFDEDGSIFFQFGRNPSEGVLASVTAAYMSPTGMLREAGWHLDQNTDVIYTPSDSGLYVGVATLPDDVLQTLPAGARFFAVRTIVDTAMTIDAFSAGPGLGMTIYQSLNSGLPTAQELLTQARERYIDSIRIRMRSKVDDSAVEFQRKREAHRAKTAQSFSSFRSKNKTEEKLIPTLPFLPHGLASSRRWGIEVESGGARGVTAPKNWTRKGDGSLRSAWEGYKEVQDFEPYDEERTENISWNACPNADRHLPHEDYYDQERGEYLWRIREDYLPATDCTECGQRTRVVRVEPQTIVHSGQSGDCAEFVSPILVSMHSKGLETLLAELSVQPQNNTAGVHVHVEANDLTPVQINTLIYGYDLLEPLIEASYQRTKREYCKRTSETDALRAARDAKGGNKGRTYEGRDRYLTVNTRALSDHGTIEFRAMGPVYDYEYLIRWAMFCREMVNVVAAGATQKDFGRIKKWSDVLNLFARFGKEYIRAAVYEMTGETGEQAKLSKAGKPLTTEAANTDLQAALAEFARRVGLVGSTVADFNQVAARLAVADEIAQPV